MSASSALSSSPGRWSFVSEASVLVLRSSSIVSLGSSVSVRVSSSSDEWRQSLQKEQSGDFTSLGGVGLASSFFSVEAPFATRTVSLPFPRPRLLHFLFLVRLLQVFFFTVSAYVADLDSFNSSAVRRGFCFVVFVVFVVFFVGQLFDQ